MAEISFRDAVRQAIAEEMARDPAVIFLGEDIGAYGGAFGVSRGLLDRFGPERILETPIAENGFTGVAVGAAAAGLKVIVEFMFMDFITLAADPIVNHAAKLHYMYDGQVSVPLVLRAPAGARGGYGASHSQSLEGLFVGVPGLKIVAPATPHAAKGLLKAAVRDPNPVLFVENKLLYPETGPVPEGEVLLPLDRARVARPGRDLTLVAHGRMVGLCLEAAGALAERGTEAEVIDLVSLQPLDAETIFASVRKTKHVAIVEEGCRTGGVGAEVAARIAEDCLEHLDGRVVRVGAADCPIPAAPSLEAAVVPDVRAVLAAATKALRW